MNYTIKLEDINLHNLFRKALSSRYSNNVILELRRIFKSEVTQRFIDAGLKVLNSTQESITSKLIDNKYEVCSPIKTPNNEILDVKFCSGYGTTYWSQTAINYYHGLYNDIPSLYSFSECLNYSIGNILFLTANIDAEITIIPSADIKIVGYSYNISKKKKKSFITIFGIHFSDSVLKDIINLYKTKDSISDLVEIRLGYTSFPMLFASKYNGDLYSCNCFKGFVDWEKDFYRHISVIENFPKIRKKIENIKYLDGICHLCTRTTPTLNYGSSMYYSGFLQKYLPYQRLEYKKRFGSIYNGTDIINTEVENELRVYFGYAKIGERWTSETMLFKLVSEIFKDNKVIFHYRGKELNGLEIDIWIPDLKLGFEYQGEQHFFEIKHWGGEAGLEKRIENDKRKKEICKMLNYQLIEIFYHEELNKETIYRKIN